MYVRNVKMLVLLLFFYLSICCDGELILVSGNSSGNLIDADVTRSTITPEVSFLTTGDFATDKETKKTLFVSKSKDASVVSNYRFLDGNAGLRGSDHTFSTWSGGRWFTVVFDLKRDYPISLVQIWSLSDNHRFTNGFELLVSKDGKKYLSRGYFKNTFPREADTFVRQDAELEKVCPVRFVKLRIERSRNSFQQQIGEVAIWALDEGSNNKIQNELVPDEVEFTAKLAGTGAAILDWSKFASVDRGIVSWKIYRSKKEFTKANRSGVELLNTVKSNVHESLITGLEPSTDYWFGITGVYNGKTGENTCVKPVKITTLAPLECRTFGDMLAVNHFPGGGGAHQSRENEKEWQIVALDMLARTPFKETRWWTHTPYWVKEFNKRGIGLLDWARSDPDYTREANEMGIYAFSAGNEPDLTGRPMEEYLERLKKSYKIIKKVDRKNVVTAPTVGIDASSLEWLDRFYAAGAKDYFDVLDIHTYCKLTGGHEVPEGIPAGAPEGLLAGTAKVRRIMAKYGDSDKPVISTELGWTTTPHGNPAGNITRQMQAEYLVRSLVLSHTLGYKRVYWYSFFDEGDDPYNQEHNFGIVDYYMQAKPAYYALITLGNQIAEGVLHGKLEGASNPVYGYVYKVNDKFVTVVWNGSKDSVAEFASDDKQLEVVSLLGSKHSVVPVDGKFRAAIGLGAIYIRSGNPVQLISNAECKQVTHGEKKLDIEIPEKVFIVKPNCSEQLRVNLDNKVDENLEVDIQLYDVNNDIVKQKKATLAIGVKKTVKIPIPSDSNKASLDKYLLRIVYQTSYGSFCEEEDVWVRKLAKVDCGTLVQTEVAVPESDKKLIVLSNDDLELSFLPAVGGRIIELIDRTSCTNQLVIDYEAIDKLSAYTFKYAYWDQVWEAKKTHLKRAQYDYELKNENGQLQLIMKANDSDFQVTKIVTFQAGKSSFAYDVNIKNISSRKLTARYYAHPEYMIGGSAEHSDDVFVMPGEKELIKIPVWLGLGGRSHAPLSEGWWAIVDTKNKIALKQNFKLDQIKNVKVWFDRTSYNAELEGEFLEYTPQQSRTIKTEFVLFSDKSAEWLELQKR